MILRLLASEERANGSLASPTEADQVVDGGLEQPDSISNLSISDSPLLMPRSSTFVANGGMRIFTYLRVLPVTDHDGSKVTTAPLLPLSWTTPSHLILLRLRHSARHIRRVA